MNSLASSHARAHAAPVFKKFDRPATTRELVEEFINIIRQGDLNLVLQYVQSFEFETRSLVELISATARQVNRPECWLANAMIATGTLHGKRIDRVQITFRVDSVRRILSISTDPAVRPVVAGPRQGASSTLPVVLPEDPHVLFRQVSRLLTLPRVPSPPPLSCR